MFFCHFCNFSSENETEYKRHRRRTECIQSRNYLFVCKRCNSTAHTLNQIKSHTCQKMFYQHNIVETMSGNLPTFTTLARSEWVKFQKLLKNLPDCVNHKKLKTKKEMLKCKDLNISPIIIYGILEYKKWLCNETCDLGELSIENVEYWKKNLEIAKRYFYFSISSSIDVRHFFKLLLAKAESIFWPFLLQNEEICKLLFSNDFCPICKDFDGVFYILQTTEPLDNALFENRHYRDFVWMKTSREDLYRFIHHEWIQHEIKNIIAFVGKYGIYEHLINFVAFFQSPTNIFQYISTKTVSSNKTFEFNVVDSSVENLVKQTCNTCMNDFVSAVSTRVESLKISSIVSQC